MSRGVFIYLLPAAWSWPHASCLACPLYQKSSYPNVSHCAVCCCECHIWHKPGQCPQILCSGFMPCTRSIATTSLTVVHQPLNPSPYRMAYSKRYKDAVFQKGYYSEKWFSWSILGQKRSMFFGFCFYLFLLGFFPVVFTSLKFNGALLLCKAQRFQLYLP